MGAQSAPSFLAFLTGLSVLDAIDECSIPVVNRHSKSEFHSSGQGRRKAHRTRREPDFVNGFLVDAVAFDEGVGQTSSISDTLRTRLMVSNNAVSYGQSARVIFVTAQGIIVECDLIGPARICDHQLNGVAIP